MTSSTARKSLPASVDWEKKIDDVAPSKLDLNNMVMNYLITEGYEEAAIKFAQEANLATSVKYNGIGERRKIRNAIQAGDIKSAIKMINGLNPQLLDTNPGIHFSLLRLQLIELIKECNASAGGDVTPAIDFATKHLAPRAPANKGFLNALEETMLLIMHQPNSPQLSAMNDPSVRQEIAKMVNDALLEADNMTSEADIRKLIRTRAFVGEELVKIQANVKINGPKTPFPPFDLGIDEDEQMSS
ncbi:hypothetical protein BJ508DRAFT_414053 [Ascobolus immersus RN42]|uniref:CTLH domain-containing protein n=1 Tax=Ascobolus immersus RN42 TaxID=1160509 RepID=A0A3N4IAY9_ASCIM|nr:hypothetical protein BJ508DRAFT_414053 [Ascobolus immersus RN42]